MRYVWMALLALGSGPAMAQWQMTDAQGRHAVPGKTHAGKGAFGVMQIATTDPEKLHQDWAKPTPNADISTDDAAFRNQPIFSFLVFRGCKAGADGLCHVSTRFTIRDPKGKLYGKPNNGPVWDQAPPPLGNLQLSMAGAGLRVEDGELLGAYRVIAKTTDHVARITLTTEQQLHVMEMPRSGGWRDVDHPNSDPQVLAAAKAALPKLPVPDAQLDKVEVALRQVVEGMNYRLTLRLRDGSRWSIKVYQRLDGGYEFGEPSRVGAQR